MNPELEKLIATFKKTLEQCPNPEAYVFENALESAFELGRKSVADELLEQEEKLLRGFGKKR